MMAKQNDSGATTSDKVQVYQTTSPLLSAMYKEIQELSKKKPEATLNKRNVSIINKLLSDIKEMLAEEPESKYLELLDDDDLPQYSDVVLILSQYSASMSKFYSRYYTTDLEHEFSDLTRGHWLTS